MRFAGARLAPGVGGASNPGGPSIIVFGVLGGGGAEPGVVGADDPSGGARFERIRIGGFLEGPSVKSIAVAGRAGGGCIGEGGGGPLAEAIPGDAVCARAGGGGGGVGFAASGGA